MSDLVDVANDLVERFTAKAEAAARGKSVPEKYPGFDGVTCVDCADSIPPIRLIMGRVRCVGCQEILETKRVRGLV